MNWDVSSYMPISYSFHSVIYCKEKGRDYGFWRLGKEMRKRLEELSYYIKELCLLVERCFIVGRPRHIIPSAHIIVIKNNELLICRPSHSYVFLDRVLPTIVWRSERTIF